MTEVSGIVQDEVRASVLHAGSRTANPALRGFNFKVLKRTLDVIGALAMLIVLSPVMLAIGFLILVSEGTPLIHRRRVLGVHGEFDAFKFRSMRTDADQILEQDSALRAAFETSFKLKADPRVTRFGGFLRKFSLDELPQLVNVLAGQMSLVGPRMITAPELEKYGSSRDQLLSVKPGMTGYWQVRGRQDLSYEERVRMDMDYISRWSLGLDLSILLLTPVRVVRGKGAY